MSHGNAEDLGRVEEWVTQVFLARIRANIMVYEYTGYSDSLGKPQERFVYSDCEAALAFLTDALGIPRNKIVLYGRSLGSGPSCYLAEKWPDLAGLVLQTPLTSIYRVIFKLRFTLPGDMFPNIDRVRRIGVPVLVIHGTRDEMVPIRHAKELFELCRSEVKRALFVEGAGHNNIEAVAGMRLFQAMQVFIDSLNTRKKAVDISSLLDEPFDT